MKKCKSKTKKKLPRYVLGTMKPIDLGYQPGRGIGTTFESTDGSDISLKGDIDAIKANRWPTAIGSFMEHLPAIKNNIYGYDKQQVNKVDADPGRTTGVPTLSASNNIHSTINSGITPLSSNIPQTTVPIYNPSFEAGMGIYSNTSPLTSTLQNAMQNNLARTGFNTAGEQLSASISQPVTSTIPTGGLQLSENALDAAKEQSLKAATEGAKGGLGKILGSASLGMNAALAAKGIYDLGHQISNFGDHRSASDMTQGLGRNYITSEYGNTAKLYNNVNKALELSYERENAKSKQANFLLSSIGTGASVGGLAGTFLPGIGNVVGTVGGAIIGALGGIGAKIFGLGDNEEDVKKQIMLAQDNIVGFNRQQDAVRKSKDMAAEFNDRMGYAKCGKSSGGNMKKYNNGKAVDPDKITLLAGPDGYKIGKPTALKAPIEPSYNTETLQGSEGEGKGKEDTVPTYAEQGDSIAIYSDEHMIGNKSIADIARPRIKQMNKYHDMLSKLDDSTPQNKLQKQMIHKAMDGLNQELLDLSNVQSMFNAQNKMNQYKCGKIPKYEFGTEALMAAAPHLASYISSVKNYNSGIKASMPDFPGIVDSAANTKALDVLANRKFNPNPIIDRLFGTYRNSLYDINRTPGLGAGGQAVARANAAVQTNKQIADVMTQADEINNKYVADYATALSNYGRWLSEQMTNNNYARAAFKQQQNAAKENWLATYDKNKLTSFADLAHDVLGVRQYGRAHDYQNKMLDLYGANLTLDQQKLANEIYQQSEANRLKREEVAAKRNWQNKFGFTPTDYYNQNSTFMPMEEFDNKLFNINPTLFRKISGKYKDGKGVIRRDKTVSGREESVSPQNLLGIGDWSTKLITNAGDTIYRDPTAANVFFSNPTQVMRSKGGEATPEYLKAKTRHEQLLNNAIASEDITPWQMVKGLFGFKCGKPAHKCGKSSKRKRC